MSNASMETTPYQTLCGLAEVEPFDSAIDISAFTQQDTFANTELNERLTAALSVLVEMAVEENKTCEKVDKVMIDSLIAQLDQRIAAQMDEIVHHPEFQQVESLWRSLDYLVDKTNFRANTKIELLDVDKQALIEDFDDAPEVAQSGLYHHVYVAEYDTPGGEPFTSMISPYEFNAGAPDVALLRNLSKVASSAHCPFIGNVGANFFNKAEISDITKIADLENHMERAEYIRWNSFRECEDSRYIGLTLPRFLLRLPYGENNPTRQFQYQEEVAGETADKYLWGRASFAMAANLTRSFKEHGWCVNIRGPEAGGKVENLPIHQYDVGQGLQSKIPSEVLLSETRELELAELGFIPLAYYKNSDYACFFSANSTQQPVLYDDPDASANSRINARLPYIYLSSRLAHYLKVIQRENIGSSKNRTQLEDELNRWLQTLITKMNNPSPELAATHPLRDGKITVNAIKENPGFFSVSLYAVPHFQIEGMDVRLSLVAEMPTGDKG